MANVDQNDEPSMEDILASIRKIIADDDDGQEGGASKDDGSEADSADASAEDIDAMFSDAAADTAPPQEDGTDEAGEGADVFELTSAMAVDGDVVFAEDNDFASDEEESAEDDFDMAGMEMAGEDEADVEFVTNPPKAELNERLTDAAAAAFLNGKGGDALLSNQAQASVASAFGNLAHTVLSKDARTLEDLVKEMLRPMLKGWLDDNLPQMVERMVREEIERLSRGGMR